MAPPGARRAPARPAAQRGAALLLLLLVLLAGGATLLMSAFAGGDGAAEAGRERRTLQRLAEAREALFGYAVAHGRLPRPAASAVDGNERARPCANAQDCSGFLPWVALGVERADGWDHLLRYSVSAALTAAPVARSVVADRVVLRRGADGTLYYLAGQDECSTELLCVPAVVLSTGRDNFGVSRLGIAAAGAAYPDESANAGAGRRFIERAPSAAAGAPGGPYDDMLTWLSAPRLLRAMDAAGQLH
ncbi:hypothetical protein CSQ96_09315 [Janthinobacterium sp. BJB412]|nr:hypothetical protein CSQ96_09315 [Janthinobacterium sp. BJB412]